MFYLFAFIVTISGSKTVISSLGNTIHVYIYEPHHDGVLYEKKLPNLYIANHLTFQLVKVLNTSKYWVLRTMRLILVQ